MLTTTWNSFSKRERHRQLFHGIAVASIPKGARHLLHTLFEYNRRDEVFTVQRLASHMGVSERTVYRRLASLRQNGIEIPTSSSFELGKILINRPQLSLLRKLCPGQYNAENCGRCDAELHVYCADVQPFIYRYLEAFDYTFPDEQELQVIHRLHDAFDAYDLCEQLRLFGKEACVTENSLCPTLEFVKNMVAQGIVDINDLVYIAKPLAGWRAVPTCDAKLSAISENLAQSYATNADGRAKTACLDGRNCIVSI